MAEEFSDFSQNMKDSACALLNHPGIVSEYFIAQVLKRRHKGSIGLHDAKELIEDYLIALCGSKSPETAPGSLAGQTRE